MEKQPIGIIGAMSVEIDALLDQMKEKEQQAISSLIFYRGLLNDVDCVVAKCGPGKVNAAVCAQAMIMQYHPRLLINSGVAGGIAPQLAVGDFVIADFCIQHDCDTTALGDPPGLISGINLVKVPCNDKAASILKETAESIYGAAYIGTIATGDSFVNSSEKSQALYAQFGAAACEMEGGSIAHVCYMNNVPVAVLRAISDKGDDTSDIDYPTFVHMAAEKLQKLLAVALPKL